MNRKWHGRALERCKPWQLNFLTVWCLFDLVFSPILLAVFSVWRKWIPGTSWLNSLLWRALTVLKAVAKQVLLALLRNKTARHCGNYSSTIKHSMNDSEHILFCRLFIQFIFISSGENKERSQDIKYAISSLILTTFQKLKKYMLVFLLSCPALVY